MEFEKGFFTPRKYSQKELEKFLKNAIDDLRIAKKSKEIKVQFRFGYDSLIKLAIFLLAYRGYKLRSVSGHHIKLLEKFSKIIDDENINLIAIDMRWKRNSELYDGGAIITEKEMETFLRCIHQVAVKMIKLFRNLK